MNQLVREQEFRHTARVMIAWRRHRTALLLFAWLSLLICALLLQRLPSQPDKKPVIKANRNSQTSITRGTRAYKSNRDQTARTSRRTNASTSSSVLETSPSHTVTILGRVIDAETRQPVNGLKINVPPEQENSPRELIANHNEFQVIVPRGPQFCLDCSAPGYTTLRTWITPNEPAAEELVVLMRRKGVLFGKLVKKSDATPLAGWTVRASHRQYSHGLWEDVNTTTDLQGMFRFPNLPDGEVSIRVTAPKIGYDPHLEESKELICHVTHDQKTDAGTVEVEAAGLLRGRLFEMPGDKPVANETVYVNLLGGEAPDGFSPRELKTASDGSFELFGIKGDPAVGHIRVGLFKYDVWVPTKRPAPGETAEVTLRIPRAVPTPTSGQ